MSETVEAPGESAEHAVTPLELFFDLVFVVAITQVTSFHLVLYANAVRDDRDLLGALLRIERHALIVLIALGESGANIVLFAVGLKTTLHHVGETLVLVAATALCGGCSFVVAYEALRYRSHRLHIRHPELTA